jgi:hypothetical protein
MTTALRQTVAMFVDAYRELAAGRRLRGRRHR